MKFYDEFLRINKIKILIIIRLGSKRLKNKAKLKINNTSLIEILIKRLLKKFNRNNVIICTSKKSSSFFFKKIKKDYKLNIFFGDEENIFKRILDCKKKYNFNHFVRITGDNPLTDVNLINKISKKHIKNKNDYTFTEGLPSGMKPEIFSINALKQCYKKARDPHSSEYLTYFFKRNEFKYSSIKIKKKYPNQDHLTITIDRKTDFLKLKRLINKEGIYLSSSKIIKYLNEKKIYKTNRNSSFKLKTKKYDVRFK